MSEAVGLFYIIIAVIVFAIGIGIPLNKKLDKVFITQRKGRKRN